MTSIAALPPAIGAAANTLCAAVATASSNGKIGGGGAGGGAAGAGGAAVAAAGAGEAFGAAAGGGEAFSPSGCMGTQAPISIVSAALHPMPTASLAILHEDRVILFIDRLS
jgi:hypothetical protein